LILANSVVLLLIVRVFSFQLFDLFGILLRVLLEVLHTFVGPRFFLIDLLVLRLEGLDPCPCCINGIVHFIFLLFGLVFTEVVKVLEQRKREMDGDAAFIDGQLREVRERIKTEKKEYEMYDAIDAAWARVESF
jgi:hypothetical protein